MPPTTTSEALAPQDLRQLLEEYYQERTLIPYQAGQIISLKPDEVWLVGRGVVVLSTLYQSGDEALLGLAAPAMPFGLPLTAIAPYQATALTDVDVMRLTMVEIESSPALRHEIDRQLARRLRQTEALLALGGYRRVEERLRQLLLLLAQEMGQPTADGLRLMVRLTHQHLANAIGTTRVTVTRLIGQLRREKWLTIDANRHLIVRYPARLGFTVP
ncbi:Crp/Fnr family transcriptional regulator [Trichothermofontia sp.]